MLPQRAANSIHRDMWRAPSTGMVKAVKADPKAEKIKARKDKKRSLRSITKEIGIVGAITLALRTRASDISQPSDASDDCPHCLKRQRARMKNVAA